MSKPEMSDTTKRIIIGVDMATKEDMSSFVWGHCARDGMFVVDGQSRTAPWWVRFSRTNILELLKHLTR